MKSSIGIAEQDFLREKKMGQIYWHAHTVYGHEKKLKERYKKEKNEKKILEPNSR